MGKLIRIDDESAICEAVSNAVILSNGGKPMRDLIASRREECEQRGYHRIDRKPKSKTDTVVCYDCELFFQPNLGIKYRIVPC